MTSSLPFRGTDAIAAGLVTPGVLRGRRYRRLFPDVYVDTDTDVDLALRSRAAHLLVRGRGVLGGHSAAELLGASCGPPGCPVELVVPGRVRRHAGLRVRQEVLAADEICRVGGIAVTAPLRTAYDLGRREPLVEAVVAVDALARVHGFPPRWVVRFGYRHVGARGAARLPGVAALADPLAESPMETRVRLAIVLAGLPVPVLQHPVGPYRLDLSYPRLRLAIEYDGAAHRTQQRTRRDLERQAFLTARGWRVLRFDADVVLRHPNVVAMTVERELAIAASSTSAS